MYAFFTLIAFIFEVSSTSQNCMPLDETSDANKLIALEDTEWYLPQQDLSRRTVTLLYRVLASILHSRVAVRSSFLEPLKLRSEWAILKNNL